MQRRSARQFEETNSIPPIGDITRNHLQMHFARHPPNTEIQIPNDNTTRQAQELDREIVNNSTVCTESSNDSFDTFYHPKN